MTIEDILAVITAVIGINLFLVATEIGNDICRFIGLMN